jgi:predicted aspartyl protease
MVVPVLVSLTFVGSVLSQEKQAGKDKGKPMPVEIKIQLGGPSKPVVLVPVLVNGKGPYQFALDTGAGQTVVSSELAKELVLDPGEKKEALGAGGKVSVSLSKVNSIAVESAKLEDLPVVIADLSLLRLAVGGKLDGVLGYNYLKKFKVTIDYPKGKLSLE